MAPIQEIHLNLHEVPVILVIVVDEPVKRLHVAMIRESQMANAARLTLANEEIEQAIVDETAVQVLHPALPYAVQQVIIDVLYPQFLEGILIQFLCFIKRPQAFVVVRHLGGHIVLFAGMTAQCGTGDTLVETAAIPRGGVKVVHTMGYGVVHQLIDQFLIVAGQAHHAEAQQGHLLACATLHTVGHADGLIGHGSR